MSSNLVNRTSLSFLITQQWYTFDSLLFSVLVGLIQLHSQPTWSISVLVGLIQLHSQPTWSVSLERRWSSRTFRYGYLVTTSPQSSVPPSAAPSLQLGHWLRALLTPMVWRAVCTRPGNVFTAAFWSAITSDSSFVQSSCRLQSELGRYFWDLLTLAGSLPFVYAIVARV